MNPLEMLVPQSSAQILPAQINRVHFIGIGGVGMSAIAWILLNKGYEVSGSDLANSSYSQRLENHGARIFYEHSPHNINGADLVVVSSAIRRDNPELRKAEEKRVPIWHRAKMLGAILQTGRSIAVAGTHGKTTTTSMVSWVFEQGGLDPTALIGGELREFGGNAKVGQTEWVVAEADESDASFLELRPNFVIITNIDSDHLDHFENYEAILDAFEGLLGRLPLDGKAVVNIEDPGVRQILERWKGDTITYSIEDPRADVFASAINLSPSGVYFDLHHCGQRLGRICLDVPGRHNISNSLAACAVAFQAGVPFKKIAAALAEYQGVGRRFEIKARVAGVTVIDDYGHHPSEVAATLQAAREWKPSQSGRIIAVFQPHRYSRTLHLGDLFENSFEAADVVAITDVYSAGEDAIPGVSGELIHKAVLRSGKSGVHYLPTKDALLEFLTREAVEDDLVLTLGAGDIWKIGESLVRYLEAR